MITLYFMVALLAMATTLPTLGQCATTAFDRNESRHNRTAAVLWAHVMFVACVLWPLMLLAAAGVGTERLRRL